MHQRVASLDFVFCDIVVVYTPICCQCQQGRVGMQFVVLRSLRTSQSFRQNTSQMHQRDTLYIFWFDMQILCAESPGECSWRVSGKTSYMHQRDDVSCTFVLDMFDIVGMMAFGYVQIARWISPDWTSHRPWRPAQI